MIADSKKRSIALQKELALVEKREKKLAQTAMSKKTPQWKAEWEEKIPSKVYSGLESGFSKAFRVVFEQGRGVIEKGYSKADLTADFEIRNYAVQRKGGRKELRQVSKGASRSGFQNLAATTLEGIGLGALGIGMPDLVLFIGTVLKGVYETALSYGFDYESPWEQAFILKMMETSLSCGADWTPNNDQVDTMIRAQTENISGHELEEQMKKTASVFAMDMLLLKFVQGLPVIGVLGGAANPVYYRKILTYVQLKYKKRYLLRLAKDTIV